MKMGIFNRHNLYALSSFLAGFAVMTVELISSRIVAPIIGSSVFTWTSVIGITLLGLALGSFAGGQIADKKEADKTLPLAFLISAVLVSFIPTLAKNTEFITNSSDSILRLNLYLAVYLFLLPTFAIGMIQPIILKKFADNFLKIGSRYGVLSFAWSAGGILGVFLTGFFFISSIGSRETVWLMAGLLFLVGSIFALKDRKITFLFLASLIVMPAIIFISQRETLNEKIIFKKETNYYSAMVVDTELPNYGEARILTLDLDIHSVETKKILENYPEMYPVFAHLKNEIRDILVIGAGAYTMPKYFHDYYQGAKVSVAELDENIIDIGNNFFDLKKYKIQTIIGDARNVINKSSQKYDIIFGDAYNSFISVPWYLLTKEWNAEVKEKLNKGGVYGINFISSLDGAKSEFFKSVLDTFKISFPNFYIFAFGGSREAVQNIVFIGMNGDKPLDEKELARRLSVGKNNFLAKKIVPALSFDGPTHLILSDNFSPVEKLMGAAVKSYFPKSLFDFKSILKL